MVLRPELVVLVPRPIIPFNPSETPGSTAQHPVRKFGSLALGNLGTARRADLEGSRGRANIVGGILHQLNQRAARCFDIRAS